MMDNEIRLYNVQVTDLELSAGKSSLKDTVRAEFQTTLQFALNFDFEGNWFDVTFKMSLTNETKTFNLKAKVVALFTTEYEINEEFEKSSFVKINAPAIAFPYVRAFISNFMLNAGYEPVILPSYNFIKLAEEMEDK